jgi:hypothetical protein
MEKSTSTNKIISNWECTVKYMIKPINRMIGGFFGKGNYNVKNKRFKF